MTKGSEGSQKPAVSWNVPGIEGLECFRARDMIHHFRRHSHEGYTIGVIEEGFGDNNYKGSVFHLAPGKIVVMNPEEAHTGQVISQRPWSYRMFYIHPDAFRALLPEKSVLPFFRGLCFESQYWFARLRGLHRLLETRNDPLAQQACFWETMAAFARVHGKASFPAPCGKEPRAVARVKEYIDAHYKQNISLDDLAGRTSLSRAYLIRTFRRWVGLPPYAYLIQTRVRKAKDLLAGRVPVAQVAFEMGFADQSHLTRHFKSITGLTPKQYALGRA